MKTTWLDAIMAKLDTAIAHRPWPKTAHYDISDFLLWINMFRLDYRGNPDPKACSWKRLGPR